MDIRTNNTKKLLQLIGQHVHTSSANKDTEYIVSISDTQWIKMTPILEIFPDRYHRKQTDRQILLLHIFNKHFPNIQIECYGDSIKLLTPNVFIQGCFRYHKSRFSKRRRWVHYKLNR